MLLMQLPVRIDLRTRPVIPHAPEVRKLGPEWTGESPQRRAQVDVTEIANDQRTSGDSRLRSYA